MTQSINSDQIAIRPDTVFDPNFDIPKGLVSARTLDTSDYQEIEEYEDDLVYVETVDGEAEDDFTDEENTLGQTDVELPVPQTATIAVQTLRFLPDGSAVVDIEIEVENVDGVSNYEVRVTKG